MKKLRYNLRTVILLVAGGALLLNVLLVSAFGSALMGAYYTKKVERQLVGAFSSLQSSNTLTMELAEQLENKGINLTIVEKTSGRLLYASRPQNRDEAMLSVQVVERCRRLLPEGETYAVTCEGEVPGMPGRGALEPGNFCYLVGVLGDCYAELSMPMESVSVMAGISQEFQILICLSVLLVLFLLLLWLSPRLVRPLRQMGETADRVAALDFSARCQPSRCREIDGLGASLNEMSDRLQTYTGQLLAVNEQLKADIAEKERAESARKRLIAGLSHDLKTPIALISGYADGLRAGMAKTPEDVEEYCSVIEDESDRMAKIIARMLELSRLESGTVQPEREVFSLSSLLQEILGLFRVELEKAGIVPEEAILQNCCVETDYGAAEQVLTNYIQNAVYHMGEGRELRVSLGAHDANWRVSVFNSARPFGEEEKSAIFETFYRGESARTRAHGESGLGLAIVKGNMELLGLPFGVENESGGVCFWAEFPKA